MKSKISSPLINHHHQAMAKIIAARYVEQKQLLNLHLCASTWISVLAQRDWHNIKQLWLHYCKIDDSNIHILNNKILPLLQNLNLYSNKITKNGMKILMNGSFNQLNSIILSYNIIGNTGIKYLTKMNLPSLAQIYLNDCKIEDEGARHLTKSNWPNLQILLIKNNKIRLTGFEAITSLSGWDNLKTLFLNKFQQNGYISGMVLLVLRPTDIQLETQVRNPGLNMHNCVNSTLQMLKDKYTHINK